MSYSSKLWMLREPTGDNLEIDKSFKMVTRELTVGDLKDGEVISKTLYLSNDPAQRAWIHKNNVEGRLYRTPIGAGDPMEAFGVAEIVESKNPDYQKGEQVFASMLWSDYCVLTPSAIVFKVAGDPTDTITLGITGLTAYFGLLNVGATTPKDATVVVSGAAGSTGSIVCQIAKNVLGIKNVVGIAGSDAKCEVLKRDCGCDVALNYKSPTFKRDFEAATPDDIDVYFDNTGGEATDLAILRMKEFGRVVVCGAIGYYDNYEQKGELSRASWMQIEAPKVEDTVWLPDDPELQLRSLTLSWPIQICHKIRIEGFIIFQFADQFAKGLGDLGQWAQEGKLKLIKQEWGAKVEDIPQGMLKLLRGENTGKLITKVVTA
ncbi:hypothetical protein Dda_5455 [Drechslerella dactyloides]|uniref:Enoyl reductase (ER) domain-containing protein n=1 Tax=Drechslerella dactyloides TaxID=74499 RepID=A0AAD6IW90_DREDA|nr:hypothetical protein Dda_5455 [Drechslerella dactyloides]